MISASDLLVAWHKSSYSSPNGGNCSRGIRLPIAGCGGFINITRIFSSPSSYRCGLEVSSGPCLNPDVPLKKRETWRLQHRGEQARASLSRGLHRQVKPNAVHQRITSLIQQLSGALGVVIVMRHIAVVGPAFGREHAVGRARKSSAQIFQDRLAIDGIGQGPAHPCIFKDRIAHIKRHVAEHGARRPLHHQIGFLFQRDDRVEG